MVGEGLFRVGGVEVSDLGVVVELQQERYPGGLGILPDDDAILITVLCRRFFDGRLLYGIRLV
jgi:hypothetical protein